MKLLLAAAIFMSLSGCASVMNDVTHGVKVDTRTEKGDIVQGAECVASNDYGSTTFKSGTTQALRRSSRDLEIVCTQAGHAPALGTATSRANAGLAGNILLGGVIGAVVDHNRGTAYTYPTWIEMVFGQTLVFDRSDEHEGTVLKGMTPGAKAAASTVTPKVGVSSNTSHQCMSQLPGAVCPR